MCHSLRFWTALWSLVVILSGGGWCAARSPEGSSPSEVEMFAAMKAGDLDVKLFMKDASAGTAVLKNCSSRPLSIKLPEAFGGVAIAAQFGGPLLGGPGGGGGQAGGGNPLFGGNQNVGGGFQNNNNRGGGGPFGPGLFNIEAGKERKLNIVSVCLEHGKDEPHPKLVYEIRPIESVTDKAEVAEVVRLLASGQADQQAAQAAAWHTANGLSWKELSDKIRLRRLDGSTERFFSIKEIDRARGLVNAARDAAKNANASLASTPLSRP